MWITRYGTQSTVQGMSIILGRRHRLLHVWALLAQRNRGETEEKKFVQYTMDLLSIPNYYIKKGRPHGHRYGKKPGDHEYYIANSLKKKCKRSSTWVSTTGSSETRSSARTCLTPVALRKCVARWTNWRTTIRTTSLQMKFEDTEPTGGSAQTK